MAQAGPSREMANEGKLGRRIVIKVADGKP